MTTLAELADEAQILLDDVTEAKWPQATIETWVNAGIRDYSQRYPLVNDETINVAEGTDIYNLAAGTRSVLRVEYPSGNDPKEFLTFRELTSEDFQNHGFYSLIYFYSDATPNQIALSDGTNEGGSMIVTRQVHHDFALDANDNITVPAEDFNVLLAFVVWKATLSLAMKEQQNPTSNSSLLMSQLAQNADVLRRRYMSDLADAGNLYRKSVIVNWYDQHTEGHVDGWEPNDRGSEGRIY